MYSRQTSSLERVYVALCPNNLSPLVSDHILRKTYSQFFFLRSRNLNSPDVDFLFGLSWNVYLFTCFTFKLDAKSMEKKNAETLTYFCHSDQQQFLRLLMKLIVIINILIIKNLAKITLHHISCGMGLAGPWGWVYRY